MAVLLSHVCYQASNQIKATLVSANQLIFNKIFHTPARQTKVKAHFQFNNHFMCIVIIIGAALIFNKIKKVNSGPARDLESSAPMMYSVPRTLDTTEPRMDKRGFLQYPHNQYNYILHTEYDAPMNLPQSDIYKCVSNSLEKKGGSPTNSYHYASSNIIQENSRNTQNIIHNSNMARSGTNYSVNKQAFNSPKDNFNYFSC